MEVALFLSLYAGLLCWVVLYGGLKHRSKALSNPSGSVSLVELTVLVPLRNEAENLPNLLDCLHRSNVRPTRWIFINDHSEDEGNSIFEYHANGLAIEWISLPDGMQGKKEALRFGMSLVTTKWVLTMDADVTFKPTYFYQIQELPEADLWILPAVLIAESPLNLWQEVDLHMMNAINVGLYGVYRPVICSGANLLFQLEVYRQVDDWEAHRSVSSGDDIFTLRAFRRAKRDVRLISEPLLAVFSPTTRGLWDFMNQRLRWIGKTTQVKDHFATFLGALQSLVSILFLAIVVRLVLRHHFETLLIFLLVKALIEWLIFAPYFFRLKRIGPWLILPVVQWLAPLYHGLLLLLIPIVKPRWKGRRVVR
jgi:cellulose synthase/poly-beta-1,6-N-acetylglucosamine synthase-like glycosyltransferase